jgi:hypothetical protein
LAALRLVAQDFFILAPTRTVSSRVQIANRKLNPEGAKRPRIRRPRPHIIGQSPQERRRNPHGWRFANEARRRHAQRKTAEMARRWEQAACVFPRNPGLDQIHTAAAPLSTMAQIHVIWVCRSTALRTRSVAGGAPAFSALFRPIAPTAPSTAAEKIVLRS